MERPSTSKKLPSYVALLPRHPAVTILVPFDVGDSYSFLSKAAKIKEEEVFEYWKSIFSSKLQEEDWRFGQFDQTPLNYTTHLVLSEKVCQGVIKEIPWLKKDRLASMEAMFFQLGIGILIIRAPIAVTLVEAIDQMTRQSSRDGFKAAVAPLLENVATLYKAVLDEAAKCNKKDWHVHRLPYVDRNVNYERVRYPYPIFFLPSEPAGVAEYTKNAYEPCLYAGDHEQVTVHVGWGESYLSWTSPEFRQAIEIDFIIGMASWYALVIMNRHASHQMLRALAVLGRHDEVAQKQRSYAIRFTYMDAANSIYPVLWTFQQRDLLLLESIHSTWSSRLLWKNVAEQTELLALHHGHLESEAKEKRDRRLAIIGLLIASLVFPSAAADVIHLEPEDIHKFIVASVIFLVLLPVIWFTLGYMGVGNDSCRTLLKKLAQIEEEANSETSEEDIHGRA